MTYPLTHRQNMVSGCQVRDSFLLGLKVKIDISHRIHVNDASLTQSQAVSDMM